MPYHEYIRSPEWMAVKKRYFASRLPKSCAICRNILVEIHHATYDRLGHENLNDLMPLCREHHQLVHDRYEERKKTGQAASLWAVTQSTVRSERRAWRSRDAAEEPAPPIAAPPTVEPVKPEPVIEKPPLSSRATGFALDALRKKLRRLPKAVRDDICAQMDQHSSPYDRLAVAQALLQAHRSQAAA